MKTWSLVALLLLAPTINAFGADSWDHEYDVDTHDWSNDFDFDDSWQDDAAGDDELRPPRRGGRRGGTMRPPRRGGGRIGRPVPPRRGGGWHRPLPPRRGDHWDRHRPRGPRGPWGPRGPRGPRGPWGPGFGNRAACVAVFASDWGPHNRRFVGRGSGYGYYNARQMACRRAMMKCRAYRNQTFERGFCRVLSRPFAY